MNNFISVWKNSFNYSGRARRKEYWLYMLFSGIIIVPLGLGGLVFSDNPSLATAPAGLFGLASLVPMMAVSVRRMHDTGRSGWWMLISLVPFLGGIWFFVLTLLDSKPETNDWGASPKYDGFAVV